MCKLYSMTSTQEAVRYGRWNYVYAGFGAGTNKALLRTLLDHAAALRAKSMPAVTIKDSLLVSS